MTTTITGVLAVFLLLLFLLWKFPKWQVTRVRGLNSKDRFTFENEARKTLAQILAGLLVLTGIYSAAMTLSVSQKSILLSEQGQITDRFTRAVDQLGAVDSMGAKKMEIRLGAIYALERIAKDSPKDYWSVMEVLTAYVRMNSPRQNDDASMQEVLTHRDEPGADIKAVITVVGRRKATHDALDDQPLDLSRTRLRGLVLGNWLSPDYHGIIFGNADLRQIQIHGADFRHSEFHESDLRGAHLPGADLSGAHLHSADIREANLHSANLNGAELHNAKLNGAHIYGADLAKANGLTQQQIDEADGDSETRLPAGLKRPAHWPTTSTGKM